MINSEGFNSGVFKSEVFNSEVFNSEVFNSEVFKPPALAGGLRPPASRDQLTIALTIPLKEIEWFN